MDRLIDLALANAAVVCVLALLVAGFSLVCRRPALLHGLWLLVLLKLLTPPLLEVPLAWPGADSGIPENAAALSAVPASFADTEEQTSEAILSTLALRAAEIEAYLATLRRDQVPAAVVDDPPAARGETAAGSWRLGVAVVWLTGSSLWFALAVRRIQRFARLLRLARPAPDYVQDLTQRLAHRLDLRRAPLVWLVPGALSPMLWALGRPRLLLPAQLLETLDAEQMTTLLAHELAHLRRRDHWVRLGEILVLGLYWWHPVAWWARHELREAEEQCCDAWVVWLLPHAVRAYATALVTTVSSFSERRAMLPLGASGIGYIHHLRRRVTMVMQASTPRKLTWSSFLIVFGLGFVILPLLPAWGQSTAQDDKEERRRSDREVELERALKQAQEQLRRLEQQQNRARQEAQRQERDAQRREENARARAEQARGREADAQNREASEAQREQAERRARQQQARAEVEHLTAQVKAQEAQLRAAQAQLEQAMASLQEARRRLDSLEPRPEGENAGPGGAMGGRFPGMGGGGSATMGRGSPGAGAGMGRGGMGGSGGGMMMGGMGPGMSGPGGGMRPGGMPSMPGGPGGMMPPGAGGDQDRRLRELEQKLDRLIQEVERLHQEQRRSPGTSGRRGGSAAGAPAAAAPATPPAPPRRPPGSPPPGAGDSEGAEALGNSSAPLLPTPPSPPLPALPAAPAGAGLPGDGPAGLPSPPSVQPPAPPARGR